MKQQAVVDAVNRAVFYCFSLDEAHQVPVGVQLDRLSTLLTAHRLVTLIGPGGVGKTRLATEAATLLADRHEESVVWVELAAVQQDEHVPAVVAAVLGSQQRSDRTVVQAVIEVLAREHSLLVLDNCEHVVAAVAELCQQLLSGSDEVRILATSREPLGVSGEARMRLRPLSVRRPEAAGAECAGGDAVDLFVDRARLIDPAFELTDQSSLLVKQVVARLDGLPLAIELAAARFESLGLTQLLQRLDHPLSVLEQGARTTPRRHQSLRRTVDWSYRLLSAQQQQVFRRVGIFSAPFPLEAAQAVAGDQAASPLLHLVDASLLVPPQQASDARLRYLMLEGLRAFAVEKLVDAGEQTATAAAMCGYYATAATRAADGIRTPGGEAAAAAWFDAEEPLVHQALFWGLEQGSVDVLAFATAVAGWWQLRGRAVSGYRLLRRALERHQGHDGDSALAQIWLGRLAQSTTEWRTALQHFEAVCDLLGSGPACSTFVDALTGRSGGLRNLWRLSEATETAEQALDLAIQLGYREGEAAALTQLSLAAEYAGDVESTMRWAVQAGQVDRSGVPDRLARRVALVLTIAHIDAGELDTAQRRCAEGLRSAREAADVPGQADFLRFSTNLELRAEAFEEVGIHLRESLRLTDLSGDRLRRLDCLEDCAQLCAATGRPAEAITLWAARTTHVVPLQLPEAALVLDPPRRLALMRRARRDLGPRGVREAELRGTMMTSDAAIQFAGMQAEGAPRRSPGAAGTPLTPRERELIALVAQGRTDAQIASELFISIRTVRSHLDRIRDKTGSRRRADLTRLALHAGLA